METAQAETDRLSIELDKANLVINKHKEDQKKIHEELTTLQVGGAMVARADMRKTGSTGSTACVIFVEAVSIFW